MIRIKKRDRKSNINTRQKTNGHNITQKIRRQNWKWASRMVRGTDKTNKILKQWYPREGERRNGRLKQRREDDIRRVTGITWGVVVLDRLD